MKDRVQGFLPQDRPDWFTTFVAGWQILVAIFPATVLVAILTKFDVGATLFTSGVSTIVAILASKNRIPFYYGSSFSFIAAVSAIVLANSVGGDVSHGVRVAQGGIIGAGVVQLVAGVLVYFLGRKWIDRILPPVLTGSIAMVIGIALAKAALDMAFSEINIAMFTLLATIFLSVYLRNVRFIGLFPILFGAIAGWIAAYVTGHVDTKAIGDAAVFQAPHLTMPIFNWAAVAAIAPLALATIPESTAHLYQLSLYVDSQADAMGRPRRQMAGLLPLSLSLHGVGDLINGLLGGPAGTNYGEANSTMAISRNYSAISVLMAGIFAIALAFIGKLAAVVTTIPAAVVGGLAIYEFGVIAKQGVALIAAEKVDLTDTRNLAIGATVLVIGIGGNVFEGGNLPGSLLGVHAPPAIAAAAVFGLLLNLIFILISPEGVEAALGLGQRRTRKDRVPLS